MRDCYVGIDLAFAKRKRLPVVICTRESGRLVPLPLRRAGIAPPRGRGNAVAVDPTEVSEFAAEAHDYIADVCGAFQLRPVQIAIDAPSAPCADELPRREAEVAMDRAGISCFATPSRSEWERIRTRVRDHLATGGLVSHLPHANQLWMLPGFALFERLHALAPVLEVFPQAIDGQSVRGAYTSRKREALRRNSVPLRATRAGPVMRRRCAPSVRLLGRPATTALMRTCPPG